MNHRHHHPTTVDTCFGCRISGIGYQGLQSRHGPDPVQTVPVIGDDGPRRGRQVGEHAIHWDGRQDANITPATLRIKAVTQEEVGP